MPPAPFRIKATSLDDSSQSYEFESIQAARRSLMEWQQKNVGGHILKKCALEGREAYGFHWEMLSPIIEKPKPLQLKGKHMDGKDIYQFYNKPVVYILECLSDGKPCVYIGKTGDIQARLNHIMKQYTKCSLYSVYNVSNTFDIEKEFNNQCRNYHYKNELYTGLRVDEFDDILARLCCGIRHPTTYDNELELARINLERIKIEKELEVVRINHEIEMKRLDFEIAKLTKQTHPQ